MLIDLSSWHYLAIFILGTLASIINMMAGGGSNIILPILMMLGIPPEVANGSNRVGIFLQSLTGIHGFARASKIPSSQQTIPILLPTLLGGLLGALLVSILPSSLLKPALLLSMLTVASWVFFKPNLFNVSANQSIKKITPYIWISLFTIGIYGGFVQASVGLLMLPIFVAVLGYDLVRANALKLICTLGFTSVSLFIFLWQGYIWWLVAIPLALGNMLGAYLGVKIALRIPTQIVRWLIFIMTLLAVLLAL